MNTPKTLQLTRAELFTLQHALGCDIAKAIKANTREYDNDNTDWIIWAQKFADRLWDEAIND